MSNADRLEEIREQFLQVQAVPVTDDYQVIVLSDYLEAVGPLLAEVERLRGVVEAARDAMPYLLQSEAWKVIPEGRTEALRAALAELEGKE